jgi:NAD(P)-dependent dehydrogenase (short-subunit alcohol dehydrogenase family)
MANWLITGCSTGIGRVIAQRALEAGETVVVTARSPDKLEDFKAYPNARLLQLDVDQPEQIEALGAKLTALAPEGIDVLINNAGYGLTGAVEEVTMEQVRAQMETNFFGLVHVTQQVLPGMRTRKRGYIVNVSSVAGLRGFRGVGIYNASKFAVTGLTEALAQEMAPFGVRVSVVAPGPYRTDWAGRSLHKSPAMTQGVADSPYADLNAAVNTNFEKANGKQEGDPTQIADVLLSAAKQALDSTQPAPPVHMLFGDEAIRYWQDKLQRYQEPGFFDNFPHARRSL